MAQNNDAMAEVEWESEIEYDGNDGEYDRSARGKLVIDGPEGRLVVLKRFRAMVDDPKGLMDTGKISEHSTYYRTDESELFIDAKASWDVPDDVLADKDAFLGDCLEALEADPQVEYEQHSDKL